MKRYLKIVLLFIILTSISGFYLNAEIIQVEGESKAVITAYISKSFFSYKGTTNLVSHMFIPVTTDHSFTTQNIKKLRKQITPFPTEINQFKDEYGNQYLDLIWKKHVRNVHIDLQFEATIYSRYYPVRSAAEYPIKMFNEDAIKYLKSTKLTPSESMVVKNLVKKIIGNKNKELDVVFSIFNWIDQNINLTEENEELDNENYDNALNVLELKKGSEKGVINLTVTLLRALDIPARVAYGISFQKEISLKAGEDNYVFNFPNGIRYWVEVYFPDSGWVAYDPRGLYFCSTANVILFSTGPDTEYVSDMWSAGEDDVDYENEYIYDIKSYNSGLKYRALTNEVTKKLILSPQIINIPKDTDLLINQENIKTENDNNSNFNSANEYYPTAIQDKLFQTFLINSEKHVDIDATKNLVYAQRFFTPYKIKVIRFQLPLIKFSDEGRVWIDIFEDNNGRPGKRIFRSFSIDSKRLRFMQLDNPWVNFPVSKNSPLLEPGYYWFALRSSGNCIFKWYAQEGNLYGGSNDTRFMNVGLKNPEWNNIINLDMNFRLSGEIISDEKPKI